MNLTSSDLANLESSGISRELAAQAQLRRVDSAEGAETVGQHGSGDFAGILFPNVLPGETGAREYRLRRDRPDIEFRDDGKPKERAKYLSPPGRGNLLYFVPGTDPQGLDDSNLPLVLTEGEKKTLALLECAWDGLGDAAESPRFLPVGLTGVWSWRGTVGKTEGPDGERRDLKGVIPDLSRINCKSRKVTILYDTNVRDNPSVQAARQGLTNELRKRGAIVSWFVWPDDTPEGLNGIDDLIGQWGTSRVRELIVTRSRPVKTTTREYRSAAREFSAVGEDHYCLNIPSLGITFDVDRLRRERHELVGQLAVRCELPGARTATGKMLSLADFNLSSARLRTDRAKLLAAHAGIDGLDWGVPLEELCQRVLLADRAGQPAIDLRMLARPNREADHIEIDGLALPRRHPTILFGDGGTCKSYLALYLAGRMAKLGIKVALFDSELAGEDHRDRLERLFPGVMPPVLYARCERPLVYEVDRLRRIVREQAVDFAIYDSVAFACDGPPEAAEVAGAYFRAVRQIGCGSLHVAHVRKSADGDKKPFGSVFWHNGARSTWFVQAAEPAGDTGILNVALHNRKANLGPVSRPVAYQITFTEKQTIFKPAEVADNPDLAQKLAIWRRMEHVLRREAMSPQAIAAEIEADLDTVKRELRRHKRTFTVLDDGRVGLRAA